jgi:hypothetical protein
MMPLSFADPEVAEFRVAAHPKEVYTLARFKTVSSRFSTAGD